MPEERVALAGGSRRQEREACGRVERLAPLDRLPEGGSRAAEKASQASRGAPCTATAQWPEAVFFVH